MSANAPAAGPWTVARLLAWTQEYLRNSGLEAPRLCAEILLAHALGCERLRLFTCHDSEPTEAQRGAYRELVRQAAAGRPIAYLTGTKEFYSLEFEVTPAVLIPRPETEILVERTISLARGAPAEIGRILDVGTGCGCIAVALARHLPEVELGASDISEAALAVARRNADRHGVGERIDFRGGDLLVPWTAGGADTFDVVVCNPPYVAEVGSPVEDSVRDYEPRGAVFAGEDGLAVIRRLVREGYAHVRRGGHLLLEVAFDQASAVRGMLADAGWQDIVSYRDPARHERVLHARGGGAEQARVA